jgi:hypothetical protein
MGDAKLSVAEMQNFAAADKVAIDDREVLRGRYSRLNELTDFRSEMSFAIFAHSDSPFA